MRNKNNAVNMKAALERAISRKREYHSVDRLVDDNRLERAISNDISVLADDAPLTLPSCLASEVPEPFPPIPTLRALDENLRELLAVDAIRQPVQLAKKLLNKHSQFLNTLSELALARELVKQGWCVKLEEKFFDSKKDVDIFSVRQGEKNFIEVTNLAPEELPANMRSGIVSEICDRDKVVGKIVAKYQKKFMEPLKRGWCGRAWVAIDVSKNHTQDISILMQSLVRDNWWVDELAAHVWHKCPDLTGVIVYSTRPTDTHAQIAAISAAPLSLFR